MSTEISDHQQSWGYEDGPWKGPEPALLVVADLVEALFTDPNWLLSHFSFPYSKPGFWRVAVNTKKNTAW